MDPITWPTPVLPFQDIEFTLLNRSTSGGLSVSGFEQVVSSAFERWTAGVTVRLRRRDQILTLRSMIAQSDGRAGTWLIPPCAGYQKVSGAAGGHALVQDIGTIVAAPFSDTGTLSDSGAFETRVVTGTLTASAALRARTITLQMNSGVPSPLGGTFFSIGGQRLYMVAGSTDNDDGTTTITMRPGLRAAASIGDLVDFSRPLCLMRLARDDTARIKLDQLQFADVSLDFVEAA